MKLDVDRFDRCINNNYDEDNNSNGRSSLGVFDIRINLSVTTSFSNVLLKAVVKVI